ncbi:hypothetical protein SOVF_010710 isoform B [Spinacia oleracea]|nr:hypothetical protein SOVF_010710 isoform B [Spinacia oleracea]
MWLAVMRRLSTCDNLLKMGVHCDQLGWSCCSVIGFQLEELVELHRMGSCCCNNLKLSGCLPFLAVNQDYVAVLFYVFLY